MSINQGSQVNINNRLRSKILSFAVDKEDMRMFCNLLQEKSLAAAEIEVQKFDRGNRTDDQLQEALKTLRESFKLRLTVSGDKGEELYGSIEDVFSSVNFPNNVKSLFVNSAHILKDVHNYYPKNSFTIFLDFSKPAVFDFSLMPSQGTPNGSNYEVQGYDATWVNGVFNEITNFIKRRGSKLSIVHSHSIYDILLWILGFPIAFRTCYLLSPYIEHIKANANAFLVNAIYLYCFFASLFVFRILFHYLRWICPLVEYKAKGSKSIAHRIFFGTILIAIIRTYVLDFIRLFLK